MAASQPSSSNSAGASTSSSPSRRGNMSRTPTPGSPQDTFGPHTPAATPATEYQARADTPESHKSGSSSYSHRDSWRAVDTATSSPAASSAAIAFARKQRVSANPPLPEKPYVPPPARALSPNTATSLLATAAFAQRDSRDLITPPPHAARSEESRTASAPQSRAPSAASRHGSARGRAKSPEDYLSAPLPPLPPMPAAYDDLVAGKTSTSSDLPRFPFLDEDPTARADSPSSFRGGVTMFSGRHSTDGSGRNKHLSVQSTYSDFGSPYGASSSMADVASTTPSAKSWGAFAGGPPPAWGRRDSAGASARSVKSTKSIRSAKSTKVQRRRSRPTGAAQTTTQEEWEDEDDVELWALVRRAAVLERLLRAGKRASSQAQGGKAYRFSMMSQSTRMSVGGSSRAPSRSASRSANASNQTPNDSSHSSPPKAPQSSTSNGSHRRSLQSASSLRTRLARRLGRTIPGRAFTGLGSDDEDDDNIIDLADTAEGNEDGSHSSHQRSMTPQTPIRRAFSTSFSRAEQNQARGQTPPGTGSGVIVFPELAALPPLEPIRDNGDLCKQSCLPPSVAVPYTPLALPPAAGLITNRSLHSLRNLRFDEKEKQTHSHSGIFSTGSGMRSSTATDPRSFNDVPACRDSQYLRSTAARRRTKVIAVIVCIIGIILITGLLAGLLTRRAHNNDKAPPPVMPSST